jgi:hypothetical protein
MQLTALVFKGKTKVLEESVSLFSSDTVKVKFLLQVARAIGISHKILEAIKEAGNARG